MRLDQDRNPFQHRVAYGQRRTPAVCDMLRAASQKQSTASANAAHERNYVRLCSAVWAASSQRVTVLIFGASGMTGPARLQPKILLITGASNSARTSNAMPKDPSGCSTARMLSGGSFGSAASAAAAASEAACAASRLRCTAPHRRCGGRQETWHVAACRKSPFPHRYL